MALARRSSQRFNTAIWPGFVDAMTGLLLVLMFVLTIFMVIQFVLQEQISGQLDRISEQENQLSLLSAEVNGLAQALGLAQNENTTLTDTLTAAETQLNAMDLQIAELRAERDATAAQLADAQGQITKFEARVAGLLESQSQDQALIADLESREQTLLSEKDALNLALATARSEIDAGAEAARLAAAQREALEAMIADLETSAEADAATIARLQSAEAEGLDQITALEAARLAEIAAAEALRDRLANADTELTAMTLALEEQRREAEETLTLLAAAEALKDDLSAQIAALTGQSQNSNSTVEDLRAQLAAALASGDAQANEAAQQAALLALANEALSQEEAISAEARREVALLNEQVSALRSQVGTLQSLLDIASEADSQAQVQIAELGSQLNTALARAAAQERRTRQLEEAARIAAEEEAARLAAEAQNLERFRSDFFGQMREILEGEDGVQIVGDRFVFSSEVLFNPGRADLSGQGREEIAKVARLLQRVSAEIPDGIDWVIRVDGHTDNLPLSGGGQFRDNWELSQARALSVVRYMERSLGIPPQRLAANGFGEYQPINRADTDEARAQNRRIELKLTER